MNRFAINWRPWKTGRFASVVIHLCVWTVVFILLLAGQIPGWIAYFDSQKTIFRYTDQPFKVVSRSVKPGEALGVYIGRCNDVSETLRYIITRSVSAPDDERSLTGRWHAVRVLEPIAFQVDPGCNTTLSNAHVVPVDLPDGTYRLEFLALVTYRGRTYSGQGISETFTVAH